MNGEKYYIEPLKNLSSSSSGSSSPESSFASSSPYLSSLHQPHIISRFSAQHFHSPSNCSITENFKHHRLKSQFVNLGNNDYRVNSSLYKQFKEAGREEEEEGAGKYDKRRGARRKRSVGVSRKHTVETLVVADAKMYEYHKDDVQQYVLTLMSVVRSIYRDPSIRNFINVVVVKLIIYETAWETPFIVSTNAAATLKEFCLWQHKINDFTPNSERHHDTAILLTREDICRAPGKCDTLGLAELGTICDTIRSCSIIEDNGISAAFTIAHELGHVFNLPHDDDKQCTNLLPDDQKNAFHVMAPILDYNASPWDWSNCSARLMTEFLETGLATCLQDGLRVKTWINTMKIYREPGWSYSVDRQCQLIFGQDFKVCPFPNSFHCRRLWCASNNISQAGCRTKHMPWADGTPCDSNKVCSQGNCLPIPNSKPKVVNGGWGPWKFYGPCSRTCGGGVKMKYRECDTPLPQNGGRFCLGSRVRYKSCNIKACSPDSREFREVQCDSEEMKNKFRIKDMPVNTTWKPKYTGVHMKDACKLFCSAGNSSTYFQFSKKVIDGTKCDHFNDDICVNGQCWAVGCDNKLGSAMKRDRCGVCGGDNFTCRTVTGVFNNAIYGYNYVVTIPSGATEVDIRQYGQIRHVKDDDNYLALQDSQRRYILNGDYTVRTEPWEVKVKGALMEYTGSEEHMERINTTMMLDESISVFVLSVGKLNPPNITYSYMVSVTKNVQWTNQGWGKCSAICNGERKSKLQCIREDDNLIVSRKRCKGLKRPSRITERCNTDCQISWRTFSKEECPVRCGTGMRRQLVHCIKQTGYKNVKIIQDKECEKIYGIKPDEYVPCQGRCLPTFWSYSDWSLCSKTCGEGTQERVTKCVDESGKELLDVECDGKERNISRPCNNGPCAEWTMGNWLGCSVTCGNGYKQRKVWCMKEGQKVEDEECGTKKPPSKKDCSLEDCPEWNTGGWGPCSVTCGTGVSMRAVKCWLGHKFQDDGVCDVSLKPVDKRACFIGACPTQNPVTTTTAKTVPKPAFWRYGSWTECSTSCGPGNKHRYVSCMDYHGNKVDESECSHLSRPPKMESCMRQPCGDWRQGDWSDCTVTCGEGIQTRFVACTFNRQRQDDRFCDITIKPETEIRCNRGTCLTADDLFIAVITSNKVVGTSHWRVGSWSACSSTCGTGWERRHVMCRDERGSSDECDKNLKPDEFRSCDSGPCPNWNVDVWSNCSAKRCNEDGLQNRLVVCRLSNGDILANSNCDNRNKPQEIMACKGPCEEQSTGAEWQPGQWSAVSPISALTPETQDERFKPTGRLHYRLPMHQQRSNQDRRYVFRYDKYLSGKMPTPSPFTGFHAWEYLKSQREKQGRNDPNIRNKNPMNLDDENSRNDHERGNFKASVIIRSNDDVAGYNYNLHSTYKGSVHGDTSVRKNTEGPSHSVNEDRFRASSVYSTERPFGHSAKDYPTNSQSQSRVASGFSSQQAVGPKDTDSRLDVERGDTESHHRRTGQHLYHLSSSSHRRATSTSSSTSAYDYKSSGHVSSGDTVRTQSQHQQPSTNHQLNTAGPVRAQSQNQLPIYHQLTTFSPSSYVRRQDNTRFPSYQRTRLQPTPEYAYHQGQNQQ